MRIDLLRQYAKLRKQLIDEKGQLETRLAEINQVVGTESDIPSASATAQSVAAPKPRIGRPPGSGMSMREAITKALSERGPLTRKELGQAVLDLGYRSKANNVLGSIGNLLYGKKSPFKSAGGKFHLAGGMAAAPGKTRKRRMSAEAREKIAAAQRARWARQRAGK
jgi:hypothetical protein